MCDLDVTVSSNMKRLVELLKERKIKHWEVVNENDPNDWVIQFKCDRQILGESIFHFITPKTRVADLWWLE